MLDAEAFESVANEAVLEVLTNNDPESPQFDRNLRQCVRRRIIDLQRQETGFRRKERKDTRSMPVDADGELIRLRDARSADPSHEAELRELAATLPSPAEVKVKALKLKAAVLDALKPEDVGDLIRAQVMKAKTGNTQSARLLLQVIGVNVASVDQTDL